MECNKDEAIRARDISERKMQNGDFEGARKIALKARQLYPELENISQMLMVCEVHCSAQHKINGTEVDWYGILHIERFSDEAVIKKQYRKYALSLHPDKNKFPGAEAAFKLIGEANRVLTDPAKRSLYDLRCQAPGRPVAPKPTPHQSNRNSQAKKQNEAVNKFSGVSSSQYMSSNLYPPPLRATFWTCCSSCNMRFQYYKELQNRTLRCQSCHQSFVALDLGFQCVSNGSPWSQFPTQNGVPNQGPSKVVPQSNSGKPSGVSLPDRFAGSGIMPKAGCRSSKSSEWKAGDAIKNGGNSSFLEKANGHVDAGVEAEKEGAAIPKPDTMKSKNSRTSKSASRKRRRKSKVGCSVSFSTESSDESEEYVVHESDTSVSPQNSRPGGSNQPRRSSRQRQNISYQESLGDDDNFVASPPKRSMATELSGVIGDGIKESGLDGGVPRKDASGFSAAMGVDRKGNEVKQKASSTIEESFPNKKGKSGACDAMGEEASLTKKADAELGDDRGKTRVDDKSNSCSDEAVKPETFVCPEADFSNFEEDKADGCFAVNQVWAIYDPADGMPRFYARIKKVFSHGFKLQITWFEASPDVTDEQAWCDKDLPVACGQFQIGGTQTTTDRIFSHQMHYITSSSRGSYLIYPKKGETWALFKDWNMKWSSEPEKHRPPYQFEYVEVLTDFTENFGIGVAYLRKVKGFVSIFQPAAENKVIACCIPPNELYRFSHRIPSFRMTGKEGMGIPTGSFELDPAALPGSLDDLGDLGDSKIENKHLAHEAIDLCSQSPKSELKSKKGSKKFCTPKKCESGPERVNSVFEESQREPEGTYKNSHRVIADVHAKVVDGSKIADHVKPTQPEGINTSCETKERIETPKKWHKGEIAADALGPRRSPRDLSKRSSQVNASQFATKGDTDENSAAKNDSKHEQSSASSSRPDDELHVYVKEGSSADLTRSPRSSGCHVMEVERYDFKMERSEDKFQISQIWALYSNEDGLPRSYCQIINIRTAPSFRLQVGMLEACSRPTDATQPFCSGTFKFKTGKTYMYSPSMFSHQMKAKSIGKNRYEIYPRKGEIWVLYKNRNYRISDEHDIVEVLEENSDGVKVAILKSANGYESFYLAPRIQRSQARVLDVRHDDFSRFSHQCCAFRHMGGRSGRRLVNCWQLDPSSIPTQVIMLD